MSASFDPKTSHCGEMPPLNSTLAPVKTKMGRGNSENSRRTTSVFLKIMKFIPVTISSRILEHRIHTGGDRFKQKLLARTPEWFQSLHPREFEKIPSKILLQASFNEWGIPEPHFFNEDHLENMSIAKLMDIASNEGKSFEDSHFLLNGLKNKLTANQKRELLVHYCNGRIRLSKLEIGFFVHLTEADLSSIIENLNSENFIIQIEGLIAHCNVQQLKYISFILNGMCQNSRDESKKKIISTALFSVVAANNTDTSIIDIATTNQPYGVDMNKIAALKTDFDILNTEVHYHITTTKSAAKIQELRARAEKFLKNMEMVKQFMNPGTVIEWTDLCTYTEKAAEENLKRVNVH